MEIFIDVDGAPRGTLNITLTNDMYVVPVLSGVFTSQFDIRQTFSDAWTSQFSINNSFLN